MLDAITRTLQAHPAFAGLSDTEAAGVAERCELLTLAEGNVLFAEGEPAGDLYVVLSGSLIVSCHGPQGVEVVVGEASGGCVVGEMGVLEEARRSATLTARRRVEVLRLRGDTFRELVRTAHPAAWTLLRSVRQQLVSRLRRVDERVDAVFEAADEESSGLHQRISGVWAAVREQGG